MPRGTANALRIGLTGGIASGKTLVADCFAELGIPVIDTDQVARDIVEPGQPALRDIRRAFGDEILTTDGRLDRRRMRALVFADADRRTELEAILHPRIRSETAARVAAAQGPYVIVVVPLLVETGFDGMTDRVLVVDCPVAMQRARLLERDAENPAQVERILAAQASRAERLTAADDIVDNSGDIDATQDQVRQLHERYLSLTKSRVCDRGPGSAK
ncbi:MAG: dephospho-CoA kinase [Gammaproteobacteria bacterium]